MLLSGFVKGVVDVEKEIVALDADMHYELADFLKEKKGSKEDMWGFNLWLENDSIEEKATEVICKWIQF